MIRGALRFSASVRESLTVEEEEGEDEEEVREGFWRTQMRKTTLRRARLKFLCSAPKRLFVRSTLLTPNFASSSQDGGFGIFGDR